MGFSTIQNLTSHTNADCLSSDMNACRSLRESLEIQDCEPREWDAFLAKTPGGSYAQTSLWALAKLAVGYRPRRFVAAAGDTIVGGAQLLIRRLPIFGAVGYVPLGPVCATQDTEVANLIVEHLHRLANEQRIFYLAVQPPLQQDAFAPRLRSSGFLPSLVNLAPTASVLIDLSKDLDHVLSKMHTATRYGVRASQRKGIRVRDGKKEDLDTFHELLLATARRQRFSTIGKHYLYEVWRLFSRGGHIKMFVAEYEGQAVSGALMMSFADTVTYWKGCWSGAHGGRYPNESLQWAAIQWAKAQGYRYYDLGGIPRTLAKSVLGGEITRNSAKDPVAFYKLGFGGQVTLFPEPLAYVYNATLRRIASRFPHLAVR